MKIRKAIIPAAGLGTRFLPATKAMPKEMLPIIDKPAIQYIVEEAVASGIEDIIIVTGKGKRAIEDHFDSSFELEQNLLTKGKYDLLSEVQKASDLTDIHYIRQKEPKGLGHAIWCARKFIGNEPFAVLLGDDIVQSDNEPCLKQMINVFNEVQSSVLAVKRVPDDEVSRYGIVDPASGENLEGSMIRVQGVVEKPAPERAPSNIAIMGRYILTPAIFDLLETQNTGAGGEIQLTDAIFRLLGQESIYAYAFEGRRYDTGEKLGYLKTIIDFALERPDLGGDVRAYLLEKLRNDLALKK
ncbi:UTP--glucose-1-phosphate uridylyltransferase GalU [Cohnella thailandensis]|uniref:UTP--glucose-1-phosphate uridylyltransferase n=1 Tax=Cohnella thailandensis TaxID=557557 RepID=A0A841SQU0_9BACL|nr:UTP--glucose-1-phosphate uridylyltransferase GalU [Cohnella thailandensis]MBB6632508.1 UTP--glucose-1-phosphate uridylyltransferase GalU [Cohnella thailandensis]MBP1971800.1 UTP--glucose-1-phosphate uridylyltransferase [Cohnella thailandensis]